MRSHSQHPGRGHPFLGGRDHSSTRHTQFNKGRNEGQQGPAGTFWNRTSSPRGTANGSSLPKTVLVLALKLPSVGSRSVPGTWAVGPPHPEPQLVTSVSSSPPATVLKFNLLPLLLTAVPPDVYCQIVFHLDLSLLKLKKSEHTMTGWILCLALAVRLASAHTRATCLSSSKDSILYSCSLLVGGRLGCFHPCKLWLCSHILLFLGSCP